MGCGRFGRREEVGQEFDEFGPGPERAECGGDGAGSQAEHQSGFGAVKRTRTGQDGRRGRQRQEDFGEFGWQGGGGKAPGEQAGGTQTAAAQVRGGEVAKPDEVIGGEVPAEIEGAAAQGGTPEAEKEKEVFPGGLGLKRREGVVHRSERVFA